MPLEAPPAKFLERFAHVEDHKRRIYSAMLTELDEGIGRVLNTLHELKLDDDTLVIFLSDNGGPTEQTTADNGPLRGRKGQVFEGGIRVPMMIRWAGHLPEGTLYDEPVIALDIFPTVLSAANAPPVHHRLIDGVDLLPYISGRSDKPPHDQLYWRYGGEEAIRKGSLKLVKLPGQRPMLFDLSRDIGETNDLAGHNAQVVYALEQLYATWNSQLIPPKWRPRSATTAAAR